MIKSHETPTFGNRHLVPIERLGVWAGRKNRGSRVRRRLLQQWLSILQDSEPTTGAQVGTFKPVSEANSGIFGVRGSYNFRPQMAAEATFGFSPAGRSQNSSAFGLVPVLVVPVGSQQGTPIAGRSPVLRDGNVYLYSGTLLTYFNQRGTWRPFFTVGAGGITRTAKIAFVQNNAVRFDPSFIISIISPTLVPSTTRTDMALVLGAGFKKYLSHGLGARVDFRDHINKFDQSTVNNMELSLGLFTRF